MVEATSDSLGPMANTYRAGGSAFVVVLLQERNVQVILEARAVAGSQAGIEKIELANARGRLRSQSAGRGPDKEPI